MALFGAAYFSKKHWAILIPLIALWISDLILNNVIYAAYYDGFSWMGVPMVYAAFILIAMMGRSFLKNIKASNLLIASLVASSIFFIVTNFGAWWVSPMYPKSGVGIIAAYTAGLPFFLNTLVGDLFFTAVLFGGYELVKRRYPTFAV